MKTIRPESPHAIARHAGPAEQLGLLDSASIAAYACDAEGRITYFNRHAEQLWGRSPKLNNAEDRFCGSFKIFLPDGSLVLREQCWMALALEEGREYHNCKVIIERPDGSRRTVLASITPFHDETGCVAGAMNILIDISSHEQAQEALRNSQLRLQATLECGGICTWVWDIQQDRIHFDDSAVKLFGFSPQEIADGNCSLFTNYVHPNDRDHFDAGVAAVLAGGGGDHEMEYRVCRPDGGVVWVAARGHVKFDDAGRPSQMIGACVDISRQKRATEKLKESEALLRMSQRIGRIGNWEWNLATNRVKWSQEMADFHGIRLDEFDGTLEMVLSYFHPDEIPVFHRHVDHFLSGGEFVPWEYRICRADGTIRYLWPAAELLCDASGKPTDMVGVSIDVTDQIRSQEALRESERRFRQLAESSFEGLIIHEQGVILDANQAFAEMFGFETADEMIGRSYLEPGILPPESQDTIYKHLQSSPEKVYEIEAILPDGSVRAFETQARDIDYKGRNARVAAVRDITDRRNREQSLRLFRTLIDRLDDAIEVIDAPTGRFLDVNDRGCLELGYSRAELLSLCVSDIDPLVPMPVYVETVKKLRESGSINLESVHRRRDGSCFPVEINVRLVRLDREYVLAVVRDISERKKHEEALRESEERFRNAFDFAAIGKGLVSLEGRWLKVNQSLCEIVGYTSEELLAMTFQAITHPDDLDEGLTLARKLIAGDIPYFHLEKRYIHKQGHVVWVLLSASLVKDSNGNPMYTIGQFQDITARKQTEEELRRQQTQLAELAIASPAAICTFRRRPDGTSCMPYVSPGIEDLYGLRAEDLAKDMSIAYALVHPDDLPALEASVVMSMKTMTLWRCEFRVLNPIRGEIWVEGRSVPSHEADGSVLWRGFVADVSDRKRLEEQLRQSQKLEAIGRLAGGIAHDFNNLLTVVNGYSRHLLDKVTSNHSAHAGLTAIHDAGQRAASLVRQLLAFSRGQALQPVVLNLREVVQQSENLLRQLLDYQIHLVIQCEPDLAPVRVDRSQMEQMLMNLVVNARDAMPQGGWLTIQADNLQLSEPRIGIGCDLPPGRYVRVSVTDTGHGMTDDVKAKIFEPFFTTKEVGKGTGLGLPVVHGIIQQSGGQIEVTSEVGVGSCFSILLPAEPV